MIDKSEEYKIMHQVETTLWWYQVLHNKTLRAIEAHFGSKEIRILDVGCGTGGMLHFLRENGYTNLQGIDLSADAIRFSRARGFTVQALDLRHIADFDSTLRFNVIICNDVLCYFNNSEISHILSEFRARLNPNGLIISNNNAFSCFEGVHSIVLNIPRRFVIEEFKSIFDGFQIKIDNYTYWSFLLSPMIWLYRKLQLIALQFGIVKIENMASDVGYPGDFVNTLFLNIVRFEERWIKAAPFGSSVFWVVQV